MGVYAPIIYFAKFTLPGYSLKFTAAKMSLYTCVYFVIEAFIMSLLIVYSCVNIGTAEACP